MRTISEVMQSEDMWRDEALRLRTQFAAEKSAREKAEAKVADLSARLEVAREGLRDVARIDTRNARSRALKALDRLGSPSPVAALKDKVVEAALNRSNWMGLGPVLGDAVRAYSAALAAAQAQEKP